MGVCCTGTSRFQHHSQFDRVADQAKRWLNNDLPNPAGNAEFSKTNAVTFEINETLTSLREVLPGSVTSAWR